MPCDINGTYIDPRTLPTPIEKSPSDFSPYSSCSEFRIAEFLFKRNQMPATEIDDLMDMWGDHSGTAPFSNHKDVYSTIDSIPIGDAPWESFSVSYSGDLPNGVVPPWMTTEYEVWHRNPSVVIKNQLSNPDFKDEINYTPFQEFAENGERQWQNLMSGNWAWSQAVRILIGFLMLIWAYC